MIASSPAGEACACDLPAAVGRSQPTVSHHLSHLVDAGLLEREQRGRWAWFSVNRDRFGQLCSILGATAC
jgi:ArsR family transcriptional regulator